MKLRHTSSRSIEAIFNYLTDMEMFTSVHPVISKIKPLGREHYIVYETLNIGPIPWSFTYPVEVIADVASGQVIMKAIVMKVTKIEMVFELSSKNGMTIIKENIQMHSPLPVKRMMRKIFRKQHIQLFKNIEALV